MRFHPSDCDIFCLFNNLPPTSPSTFGLITVQLTNRTVPDLTSRSNQSTVRVIISPINDYIVQSLHVYECCVAVKLSLYFDKKLAQTVRSSETRSVRTDSVESRDCSQTPRGKLLPLSCVRHATEPSRTRVLLTVVPLIRPTSFTLPRQFFIIIRSESASICAPVYVCTHVCICTSVRVPVPHLYPFQQFPNYRDVAPRCVSPPEAHPPLNERPFPEPPALNFLSPPLPSPRLNALKSPLPCDHVLIPSPSEASASSTITTRASCPAQRCRPCPRVPEPPVRNRQPRGRRRPRRALRERRCTRASPGAHRAVVGRPATCERLLRGGVAADRPGWSRRPFDCTLRPRPMRFRKTCRRSACRPPAPTPCPACARRPLLSCAQTVAESVCAVLAGLVCGTTDTDFDFHSHRIRADSPGWLSAIAPLLNCQLACVNLVHASVPMTYCLLLICSVLIRNYTLLKYY